VATGLLTLRRFRCGWPWSPDHLLPTLESHHFCPHL